MGRKGGLHGSDSLLNLSTSGEPGTSSEQELGPGFKIFMFDSCDHPV